MRDARGGRQLVIVCAAVLLVAAACSSFREGEGAGGPDADAATSADAATIADAATSADAGKNADAGTKLDAAPGANAAPCGVGLVLRGRFATLTGKVNVHTPVSTALTEKPAFMSNGWYADPDCKSGSDLNELPYCQRLWPNSTVRHGPFLASSELKPFYTALCGTGSELPGREEFLCCGPAAP